MENLQDLLLAFGAIWVGGAQAGRGSDGVAVRGKLCLCVCRCKCVTCVLCVTRCQLHTSITVTAKCHSLPRRVIVAYHHPFVIVSKSTSSFAWHWHNAFSLIDLKKHECCSCSCCYICILCVVYRPSTMFSGRVALLLPIGYKVWSSECDCYVNSNLCT